MSLSPAATVVLTRAAERPDRRREFHRKLPTAARHKMIDALLRDGLIVEIKGWVDLQFEDGRKIRLNAGDTLTIPGGTRHNEIATSEEMDILEILVPAGM